MKITLGEVVELVRKNDLKFLKELYKSVYPKVERYIVSNGGTKEDAEDIFQVMLINLVERARKRKFDKENLFVEIFLFKGVEYQWRTERKMKLKRSESFRKIDFDDIQIPQFPDLPIAYVNQILSFELKNKWHPREFGEFLIAIEDLYMALIFSFAANRLRKRKNLKETIYTDTALLFGVRPVINKIVQQSPGSLDIFGVGKILEQVKDIVVSFLEFNQNRKLKNVELKIKKEELKAKRIENAKNFIELVKSSGHDVGYINQLTEFIEEKQKPIIKAIENGNVTDVNLK